MFYISFVNYRQTMRYKDVALILAAALIVVANLKFGRRKAPKSNKRRKRRRKSTEEKDNMHSAKSQNKVMEFT